MPSDRPEYLNYDETADLTRLTVSTLRHMRSRGEGPPACTLGKRRVVFKRADVVAWIEGHATSEALNAAS